MDIVIFTFIFIFALLATFFNPFIGLLAFTVSLYLKFAAFNPLFYHFHITRVLGIAIFIIIFIKGRKKGVQFFGMKQSKWLLLLLFSMILSIVTSIWRGHSIEFLGGFFKVVIAYFLVINVVDSPKRLRYLITTMILCMLYIITTAIKAHYETGAIYQGERMFAAFSGALFGDPNDMAMGAIIMIPFLYFDLFRKKAVLKRALAIIIIGIFLWGIVLTQSRGGFLGLGVTAFLIWLRSRKKAALLILAVFVGIGLWQASPESFKQRIMTIETASTEDASAMLRLDSWKAGLKMIARRPLGVGVGNFSEGYVQYRPETSIDYKGSRRVAHNMFIEVGGEMGVAGLFIFVMLIVSALKAFQGIKNQVMMRLYTDEQIKEMIILANAGLVSLMSYCVAGIFLSQNYNFVLYYLIAFSVVLERLSSGYFEKLAEQENKIKINECDKRWKSRAASIELDK